MKNPFSSKPADPITDLSAAAETAAEALTAGRTAQKAAADRLTTAQRHHADAAAALQRLSDTGAPNDQVVAAATSLGAAKHAMAAAVLTVEGADAEVNRLAGVLEAADNDVLVEKVAGGKEAKANKVDAFRTDKVPVFFDEMGALAADARPDVAVALGLEGFAPDAKIQVDVALKAIADELRQLAKAIRRGDAKPIVQHAKPALVAAAPDRPVTGQIFTIRKIRWHENDQPGWRTAHAWVDVTLPVACADRAIDLELAVKPGDPKAREMRGKQAVYPPPHSDHCATVDPVGFVAPVGTPEPRGAIHSKFTPVDRGPAYKVPVAAPAPAMAVRKQSEDDGDPK